MPRNAPHERNGSMTEFIIRAIRDGDEEPVAALWRVCGLMRPWNDPLSDIRRARANASSEVFVAIAEETGCIAGSIMAGTDGHRGWVYYVAVTSEHRAQGLGERLVRHAEAWLRQLGTPKINLMIREENRTVRRFYEGLGYEIEQRTIMSRWTDEGS